MSAIRLVQYKDKNEYEKQYDAIIRDFPIIFPELNIIYGRKVFFNGAVGYTLNNYNKELSTHNQFIIKILLTTNIDIGSFNKFDPCNPLRSWLCRM